MRRARTVVAIGALAALAASGTAAAGEVTISQKDKLFAPDSVTVAAGGTVKFVNDDSVTHNVTVKGPGGEQNSGAMKAGDEFAFAIGSAGAYEARCAIHPKMKLRIIAN